MRFVQNLIDGISLGSLYALIAIGYTMVYGILRLINFAHGDLFMLGAYICFYLLSWTSLPWWLVYIVAALITGVCGIALEKIAYAPLRKSPRVTVLISAIGASFLLENLAILVFGGRPQAFPVPSFLDTSVKVGSLSFNVVQLVIPITTVILLLILTFLVEKTKMGMAMRAMASDYEASALMGIDVNKVISFTFLLGTTLAGFGGVLYASRYPQLMPLMGLMPGNKCFIAAVIGGIGNLKGAVVGGMIIGLSEILLVGLLPNLNDYRDAFAFIILIIILIVKPTGLFGSTAQEKV